MTTGDKVAVSLRMSPLAECYNGCMILSTSAIARTICWLILLASTLWVVPDRLWMLGLTLPVLLLLTADPQRWLRWLLLTIASAGFFLLAIYVGGIIAAGWNWSFTAREMDRAARLAIAVGAALGLGEALRDEKLRLALLWRLGGTMAALTFMGAPRQRELARCTAAIHSTRSVRRRRWGNALHHLTARYWNQAPGTAITLIMRGWGANRLTSPSFPSPRLIDIPLLIVIIAATVFFTLC
jgi:hypothetical protein